MASTPRDGAAAGLVEHFFRREYGRLVAVLTRKLTREGKTLDVTADEDPPPLMRTDVETEGA